MNNQRIMNNNLVYSYSPIIRIPINPRILEIFNLISNNDQEYESIIEETLNEKKATKRMCEDFKSGLTKRLINEEDVRVKLSCAICQEPFELNETIIELPCKEGAPHIFHCKEDEKTCPGIYPWIRENNTCPICRVEFPSEPEPEPEPEHED